MHNFFFIWLIPLEPSETVQAEDDAPLAVRRSWRTNHQPPKRFQDMLPEPLLPLPPQDANLLLEVDALQANSGPCPSVTPNIPSSQADPTAQSAQPPSKSCAVLTTQKNSFGLFCIYDAESIPNANDPEDQSGAGPLPAHRLNVPTSQMLPGSMNPFHPYLNESSWLIGDWFWNQGAQKSKQNFKNLVGIIKSANFQSEDLHQTNWTAIDCQLGSLGSVHDPSQTTSMAASSEEWEAEDGNWMRRVITISIPFPRRFLHPGPRNYTISNFYRWSLLLIIREILSDLACCRYFHFEPYLLQWKRLDGVDDISIHGELFTSQAFIAAYHDLQSAPLAPTSCTLPRCIVALMFWSDTTQLTAFRDAKLWPLYVYFGNESKYERCTPIANLCSHAAYFQTVCVLCLQWTNFNHCFQFSYPIISRIL